MRFGRKLALQVTADQSGAPYLSHKAMKEAINKTVRELRVYQSMVQSAESFHAGRAVAPGEVIPTRENVSEIERRIKEHDQELFTIVEEDLRNIFEHVRAGEVQLEAFLGDLQVEAIEIGLLMEESNLADLQRTLPVAPATREVLCQKLLELRLQSDPIGMARSIGELTARYNTFVDLMDQHMQYMEINVAGFRKLLKRHEKQIPTCFHACPTPFLEFHRLVTRASRQICELARMFEAVLGDARVRLASAVAQVHSSHRSLGAEADISWICDTLPVMREAKGLGAECEMVLQIQQKLKDPCTHLLLPAEGASAGSLYPKPGAVADLPSMATQGEDYEDEPVIPPLGRASSSWGRHNVSHTTIAPIGAASYMVPPGMC